MAATPSTMIPLGTEAPDFALHNPVTGQVQSLESVAGRYGTLVMFICNHCPYVKHVAHELARLSADYMTKGIGLVAINSNDAEHYPADSPEQMVEEVQRRSYPFPYLFDETQETAKAYGAVCTPDFFLFDSSQLLVYRGQLDGSRPGNDVPVDGADMRRALDALLAGEPVAEEQHPSVGCNIKWKK